MRQWIESAFVHMMACDLFGCKPLSKLMLDYFQLDPLDTIIFIYENVSENIVCDMAAIFSSGRWVTGQVMPWLNGDVNISIEHVPNSNPFNSAYGKGCYAYHDNALASAMFCYPSILVNDDCHK